MTGPRPPGADRDDQACAETDHCLTCADEGVRVVVTLLLGDDLALVRTPSGQQEEVSVALVDARVGDHLLIHAKEALTVLEAPR